MVKKGLSSSDNFRGICLQSVLCKLFDIFILQREKAAIITSDLQFGFKEKVSATLATALVTETLRRLIESSTINCSTFSLNAVATYFLYVCC